MARNSIIEKLMTLLASKQPFEEECQVLYLMVEIRKVLKLNDNANYKLITYYRDWLVHHKKNNNDAIQNTIKLFYKSAKQQIEEGKDFLENNAIVDFLDLVELQRELIDFFITEELPDELFVNQKFWAAFVKLIYSILSDQPMEKPIDEISSITFSYKESGIIGKINFTSPILTKNGESYPSYDFHYPLTIKSSKAL